MATQFPYFSRNGQILPIDQAVMPLSNIEYSYGFGVYETLRIRNGIIYFVDQHVARLEKSAEIIGLTHPYTKQQIIQYIRELADALKLVEEQGSCNIKILLIGGREPQLFIMALAPLFTDRKLYTQGAKTITVQYERIFPHAKTLNMLSSYLAFKKAQDEECFDGLFISKEGTILEGTRSNFFAIKGRTLVMPPKEQVLEGVTLQTVIAVAKKIGFTVEESNIPLADIAQYDGAFFTTTISKIVPISQIDDYVLEIPETLRELMAAYDAFLKESQGIFTA